MCRHTENYKTHLELSVKTAEQLPKQNWQIDSFDEVNVYHNESEWVLTGVKNKIVH